MLGRWDYWTRFLMTTMLTSSTKHSKAKIALGDTHAHTRAHTHTCTLMLQAMFVSVGAPTRQSCKHLWALMRMATATGTWRAAECTRGCVNPMGLPMGREMCSAHLTHAERKGSGPHRLGSEKVRQGTTGVSMLRTRAAFVVDSIKSSPMRPTSAVVLPSCDRGSILRTCREGLAVLEREEMKK
eukprot:scaffold264919_cov19-Tisochrysis_lutea.AAC.1